MKNGRTHHESFESVLDGIRPIGVLLVILLIAGLLAVFFGGSTPAEASIPEPYSFHLNYLAPDRTVVNEDISLNEHSKTVVCREGSRVGVLICDNQKKGFFLREGTFVEISESGTRSESFDYSKESATNLGFDISAGNTGILTLNYGTVDDPIWYVLKVETTCE